MDRVADPDGGGIGTGGIGAGGIGAGGIGAGGIGTGGPADDGAARAVPPGRVPVTGVVSAPDDPVEADAWHRALHRVLLVRHPHLAPLVAVAPAPGGLALEHELPVGWTTLGTLLGDVPSLSAGQAVTVGVPLAESLAALHEADVSPGAWAVDDVVVDRVGRPELVVRRARPLARGDDAADVKALAVMLRDLLAPGAAPAALTLVLLRAGDDPHDPVPASTLAASLRRACAATPLPAAATESGPALQPLTAGIAVPGAQPDLAAPDLAAPVLAGTDLAAPMAGTGTAEPDVEEGLGAAAARQAGEALAALRARARAATSSSPGRRRGRSAGRPRARPPATHGSGGASTPTTPEVSTRRRGPRRRVVALVGALAVAVLTASGVAWASRPAPAPSPAPGEAAAVAASSSAVPRATSPTAASTSSATLAAGLRWEAVLAAVDAARAEAFAALDRDGLAAAVVPGSTAWRADVAQLEALAGAGVRPVGQRWEVLEVAEIAVTAQRAVLAVVDRRTAYDLVDDAGVVVVHRPARARAGWRIELVGGQGAWRVAAVVARE